MNPIIANAVMVLVLTSCTGIKNLYKPATPPSETISVNENDAKVIQRALEILSNGENWNQKDNRICLPKAHKFSLYCSLFKASEEVNGEFDHRSGALETVRRTIEEAPKEKHYEHRLMDYNNDPSTSFEDIRQILMASKKKIDKELRKN